MPQPQRTQPPTSPSYRLYLRAGSCMGALRPSGSSQRIDFYSSHCVLGDLCGEIIRYYNTEYVHYSSFQKYVPIDS